MSGAEFSWYEYVHSIDSILCEDYCNTTSQEN